MRKDWSVEISGQPENMKENLMKRACVMERGNGPAMMEPFYMMASGLMDGLMAGVGSISTNLYTKGFFQRENLTGMEDFLERMEN